MFFFSSKKAKNELENLRGLNVCVTGKSSFGTRDEVSGMLRKAGARVVKRIYPDTDVLLVGSLGSPTWVCGEDGGSKHVKAKRYGISIMTEKESFYR